MAFAGLLTLVDDIATILDDVAVLSKVAAKKTAGVLGDDLALNAEQVSGVRAEREIPVVWAVAKGSAKNKLIIVPVALLLSAFLPMLITPLLIVGGSFLCFEGTEKVLHKFFHKKEASHEKEEVQRTFENQEVDLVALEQKKIKGAIRTDFILSAEIVVIALGAVQGKDFLTQAIVVALIAFGITVAVYGLVAIIVKLDDFGLYLQRTGEGLKASIGRGILQLCPWLMKSLAILGTIAMFLVGGGILVHGFPFLHHGLEAVHGMLHSLPAMVTDLLFNLVIGFLAGLILVVIVEMGSKLWGKKDEAKEGAEH